MLIARLPPATDAADEMDSLATMKASQLKELCKEFGLKVSGKKDDLISRIKEHLIQQKTNDAKADNDLDSMTEEDLRDAIVGRGLQVVGTTRDELLQQYIEDIEFVEDVKTAGEAAASASTGFTSVNDLVTRALESKAAEGGSVADVMQEMKQKSEQIPKFVELRIPSLGLAPTKATAGGAPSVTADVLRKLAGDPYSDPPRYGEVRQSLSLHLS
jgi:SAP domain/LETM1-like protein